MHTFSLARFWESSISSLNLSDLSVLFLDQLSLLLLHFYLLFFLYKGQCSFQSSFFLLKQKRFTGNTMELAFDPILSVLLFLEAWVDLLEAWETVLILLQTTWCHQQCLETQSKQLDSFKFILISWLTSSQKSPPNSLDQFFFSWSSDYLSSRFADMYTPFRSFWPPSFHGATGFENYLFFFTTFWHHMFRITGTWIDCDGHNSKWMLLWLPPYT